MVYKVYANGDYVGITKALSEEYAINVIKNQCAQRGEVEWVESVQWSTKILQKRL